jgi:sensor histidine kinase YesM
MNLKKTYWLCQILGWGSYSAVGLWSAAQEVGWLPTLITGYGLFFAYSIGLTDLFRRDIIRRQWLTASVGRMFGRLVPGALVIAAIQTFLVVTIQTALDGTSNAFLQHPSYILGLWVGVTGAMLAWTLLYVALTGSRRSREKEVHLQLAVREAELRALEAQVHPHFLFNSLNSIRALIIENPAQAQDMITRLANILRYNLRGDSDHTVPLASELDIVGDYLALEAVRLEDRLRVRLEIARDARSVEVPPMLLQTLVENALKHGIAPASAGGELAIRATVENDSLLLDVENSGHLTEPGPGAGQVGLANTRDRLRILYGARASLQLANRGSDRVAATVRLPRTA